LEMDSSPIPARPLRVVADLVFGEFLIVRNTPSSAVELAKNTFVLNAFLLWVYDCPARFYPCGVVHRNVVCKYCYLALQVLSLTSALGVTRSALEGPDG